MAREIRPSEGAFKTLIYDVKSSGNQAERALRLTAENMSESYPETSKVILNDIYVDDCISGTNNKSKLISVMDELKVGLETGGFTLKGFTFVGSDPDVHSSADGKSINVGGLKWYSQEDKIGINVSKLNFEKKLRGRKSANGDGALPEKITKRDCASKVAELFDPLGRIVPLIAGTNQDISLLHASGLNWGR